MAKQSILQRIIHTAADRLAADPAIPAASRAAFRSAAVSVFEAQVRAVIGYDEVRVRGWSVLPSERVARRQRIEAALRAGESPGHIAQRERVSGQYVYKIRAGLLQIQPMGR